VKRPTERERNASQQTRSTRSFIREVERGLHVAMQGAIQIRTDELPREHAAEWSEEGKGLAQRLADVCRDFDRWKVKVAL
jgi:hypothetical protein